MANFAYQVTNFAYQGAGLFAYQGDAGDVSVEPAIRNFSLREWRKWHRLEDERELRKLQITPAVAEVIANVAERQAQTLEVDERKRIKELTRELELKRLRFQARYLELLNTERQQIIDAEIKSFYEAKYALDEENKRRLLLLLTFLS